MSDTVWLHVPVNPEPWAIGDVSVGKRGGKIFPRVSPNGQLVAFQEAVRSELNGREALPPGEYDLYFYFWRRLDDYETESGRRHRKHYADATNMQKATEDALQGVLIDNDRNVRKVGSEIVEQGPDVTPAIVIRAEMYAGLTPHEESAIPESIWAQMALDSQPKFDFDNSWPPKEAL